MFRHIETGLNFTAAVALALLCLLIASNVLARSLLGTGVPDSVVLTRELMVAAILFPLAAATSQRAHVAIDFFAVHFPPGLQRWIAVVAALIGLMVALPLLYAGWRELAETFTRDARFPGVLSVPKWPGRALFVIALLAFALRLIHLFWVDLHAALAGRDAPDRL